MLACFSAAFDGLIQMNQPILQKLVNQLLVNFNDFRKTYITKKYHSPGETITHRKLKQIRNNAYSTAKKRYYETKFSKKNIGTKQQWQIIRDVIQLDNKYQTDIPNIYHKTSGHLLATTTVAKVLHFNTVFL